VRLNWNYSAEPKLYLARHKRKKHRRAALRLVLEERQRQLERWDPHDNDDGHTPFVWVALLAEHLGKLSLAAFRLDHKAACQALVVLAALCLAALETEPLPETAFDWLEGDSDDDAATTVDTGDTVRDLLAPAAEGGAL